MCVGCVVGVLLLGSPREEERKEWRKRAIGERHGPMRGDYSFFADVHFFILSFVCGNHIIINFVTKSFGVFGGACAKWGVIFVSLTDFCFGFFLEPGFPILEVCKGEDKNAKKNKSHLQKNPFPKKQQRKKINTT